MCIRDRGDTLSSIAARYNSTVSAIAGTNDLSNPNLIYVGERLLIPAVRQYNGTTYTVRPGDTLSEIAARDVYKRQVYVSAMEGIEHAQNAVKGLKSAAGYIRHELSLRLRLRHTPELRFIADNSIEHSADISKLLDSLARSDKHDQDNEE